MAHWPFLASDEYSHEHTRVVDHEVNSTAKKEGVVLEFNRQSYEHEDKTSILQ